MRKPALTENEMLLREVEETEQALADISKALGCVCIIDPTETLGDRVRHLGMMTVLMQATLMQIRDLDDQRMVSSDGPVDMLRKLEEN